MTAERTRDLLLDHAQLVVADARRAKADPEAVAALLHRTWPAPAAVDPGFRADPATGVEALAFVVTGPEGGRAGGVVLRLPGEYPDSFEPVGLPATGSDPLDAVHRAFFRRA